MAAITGARTAAGTSCATATIPATVAPPRLKAKTSIAIHAEYSVRTNSGIRRQDA